MVMEDPKSKPKKKDFDDNSENEETRSDLVPEKSGKTKSPKKKKISSKAYEREIEKLQIELVKLQGWIKEMGLKVVVIFEGRDAAGKGGTIKRITESLIPELCV